MSYYLLSLPLNNTPIFQIDFKFISWILYSSVGSIGQGTKDPYIVLSKMLFSPGHTSLILDCQIRVEY